MQRSATTVASIKSRRIFYLVFATITLLVLGLIYAWSIFARPIGLAFPEYGPLLSQVFQVSMFAFCISALFGAQIYKRISPRAAIIVAALLLGGGFILTAFLADFGVWTLFVFYGIIAASGCGIAYNAIISLINPWFPDRVGLCSGVLMMGFGISSLVFGSLANAAFSAVSDWSIVFVVIAIVGVVVMFALAFVARPAPVDIASQLKLTGTAVATQTSSTKNQNILLTKVFWLYCIWGTFIVACGLMLIGSSAQGAEALGVDPGAAALLVGLVSTMNGLSRIISGAIFDKFGLVTVMVFGGTLAVVTMVCLAVSFALGAGALASILYFIVAIVVALPYGSVPVMASAYARQRYNAAEFAKNLGIANCIIAVAATVNLIVAAFFGPAYAGNGAIIYGVLTALAVISLLVVIAFNRVYKSDLAQINKELQAPE